MKGTIRRTGHSSWIWTPPVLTEDEQNDIAGMVAMQQFAMQPSWHVCPTCGSQFRDPQANAPAGSFYARAGGLGSTFG